MNDPEMITIRKDVYDVLRFNADILIALEAAGVDNWPGHQEVMRQFSEEREELDERLWGESHS